jgi:hypothetical protein
MIFLKEKYLPTGEFEKLKARLVALGNFQDRSLFSEEDLNSPTVNLLSLFSMAVLAHKEGRAVKAVDIGGAYLKASIGEKEVIMKIDRLLSHILIQIDPNIEPYLDERGELVVRLNRALYGCVQSALQWHKEISGFLHSIGFTVNEMDPCVFNKVDKAGKQLTILMHVDDLLFMGRVEEIDATIESLRQKYKEITVHEGPVLPYLGMVFDFSGDRVRISMDKYTDDLLKLYSVKSKAKTPATVSLFSINESSSRLSKEHTEEFHSRVAKLLYLAKRVRPEILPAVSFLTSRVLEPTEQDREKLNRVLSYLNYCPHLGIGLSSEDSVKILGYIDVSFASDKDFKSRTGVVISLGRGPCYTDSSRQKLNTKSSTEAELVGASDGSGNIFWLRNFLIQQGYKTEPATIFQDNKSTLAMLERGRSTHKTTRHINIRYFYLKSRVEEGEVVLEYMPTTDMLADLLTKPIQGEQFVRLRDSLLNW